MNIDTRTISKYFIGYAEKSKEYMFYCPNHSMRIVETGNAKEKLIWYQYVCVCVCVYIYIYY